MYRCLLVALRALRATLVVKYFLWKIDRLRRSENEFFFKVFFLVIGTDNTFFCGKSEDHRPILTHFFWKEVWWYERVSGRNSAGKSIFGRRSRKKEKKNFKKNRFFRFFQKLSKSSVNIEFCFKNTLNTSRGQFLPIFYHISQNKPLEKNRFFGRKSWFFEIFEIFWILMMRSIIWPERAGNVQYG